MGGKPRTSTTKPQGPRPLDLDDPATQGNIFEKVERENWISELKKQGYAEFHEPINDRRPGETGRFRGWPKGAFTSGSQGPDFIAVNHTKKKIIVGDITSGPWSLSDSKPGERRQLPNELEPEAKAPHLSKTIEDAKQLARNLPQEFKDYEMVAQDRYWDERSPQKISREISVYKNGKITLPSSSTSPITTVKQPSGDTPTGNTNEPSQGRGVSKTDDPRATAATGTGNRATTGSGKPTPADLAPESPSGPSKRAVSKTLSAIGEVVSGPSLPPILVPELKNVKLNPKIKIAGGMIVTIVFDIGLGYLSSYFTERKILRMLKGLEPRIKDEIDKIAKKDWFLKEVNKFRLDDQNNGYQLYFKVLLWFNRSWSDGGAGWSGSFYSIELDAIELKRSKGSDYIPDAKSSSGEYTGGANRDRVSGFFYIPIFPGGYDITPGDEVAADEHFTEITNMIMGSAIPQNYWVSYIRGFEFYTKLFSKSKAAEVWKKLTTTPDGKPRIEYEKLLIGLGLLDWKKSYYFKDKTVADVYIEVRRWLDETKRKILPEITWYLYNLSQTDQRKMQDLRRKIYLPSHFFNEFEYLVVSTEQSRGCLPGNRLTTSEYITPWGERGTIRRYFLPSSGLYREERIPQATVNGVRNDEYLHRPPTATPRPTSQPKPPQPPLNSTPSLTDDQWRAIEALRDSGRFTEDRFGNWRPTSHVRRDIQAENNYNERLYYDSWGSGYKTTRTTLGEKTAVTEENILGWARYRLERGADAKELYINLRRGREFVFVPEALPAIHSYSPDQTREDSTRQWWVDFLKGKEKEWNF
ncbi:hypothetical protein DCC62_03005 [candidate division KSB1 bacterium]|nr:MAG: hypothetical protein DCC62_03005 [candidate division KSB1 bacterium]